MVTPEDVAVTRRIAIVLLPGIDQMLIDEFDLTPEEFDDVLSDMKSWSTGLAGGVVAYQRTGERRYRIKPYVDVRATGSRVYEQACGSGSLALALYLAKCGELAGKLTVEQPCGDTIDVDVNADGTATLATDVCFPCEGTLSIWN